MLVLEHVNKTYGAGESQVHAAVDVSLRIPRGCFAVITGPSGSGKSTLLRMIGLVEPMDSGLYLIGGKPQNGQTEKARCRTRLTQIGYVHQFFHLLEDETALGNVALPLGYLGVKKKEREARALEMLERVGLKERAQHRPAMLSGGEQQRVAIARALVTRPAILLADEPTGNLDSQTSRQIQQLLRALQQKGQTVVMVTHDERVVQPGDMHILVCDGRAKVAAEAAL